MNKEMQGNAKKITEGSLLLYRTRGAIMRSEEHVGEYDDARMDRRRFKYPSGSRVLFDL